MGLLDFNFDDPKTMGLLQAGLGMMGQAGDTSRPFNVGQALQGGLNAYTGTIDAARKRKQEEAQQAQIAQLRDMQIKQAQYGLDDVQSQRGQAARVQQIIGSMGDDYQGMIRAGVPPDLVKSIAESKNLGRAKVSRTLDVPSADGGKMTQMLDDYGQQVGASMPSYVAPIVMDQGNKKSLITPMAGQSFAMGLSPEAQAANARANAQMAQSASQFNQKMAFDKSGGAEGVKPKYVDGQWVTPPTNMQPGQSVAAFPSTAKKDATEALSLIKTARELIPKSTGSYLGAGVDQVGRAFGGSTGGDIAAAQLQALEGSLVSKMPKMSGPQSDKDVLLYKQMAGQIGDPTIPQARKIAALNVIEEIMVRNAGGGANIPPSGGGSGSWGIERVK